MKREFFVAIGASFLVVMVLTAFFCFIDQTSCKASWADSGMPSRWSFSGGCQLRLKSGAWVPADNYRTE